MFVPPALLCGARGCFCSIVFVWIDCHLALCANGVSFAAAKAPLYITCIAFLSLLASKALRSWSIEKTHEPPLERVSKQTRAHTHTNTHTHDLARTVDEPAFVIYSYIVRYIKRAQVELFGKARVR